MPKKTNARPESSARARRFEAAFVDGVARVPRHARPALLAWLRRWRLRPERVFVFVDDE